MDDNQLKMERLNKFMKELSDRSCSREKERGRFPEIEHVLLTVHYFDADILNGGFSQLLINKGDQWKEILKALRTIGARRPAQLFVRAFRLIFPDNNPSPDFEGRVRQYRDASESSQEIVEDLTNEYCQMFDNYLKHSDEPYELYLYMAEYLNRQSPNP